VLGGILQVKDIIFLSGKFGLTKMIFDSQNRKVIQAVPGDLVRVVGLNFLTELGENFLIIKKEKDKKDIEKEISDYLTNKKKNHFSVSW